MKRYLYVVQRQSPTTFVRELQAFEQPLEIKGEFIDENNKFGTDFRGDLTESVTFLGIYEYKNLREMRKGLQNLSNSFNLSCRYTYDKKLYLIAAQQHREGVWRDRDLIFHQVRPHMVDNGSEHIVIGKDTEEDGGESVDNNSFSAEFPKWKENYECLLQMGFDRQNALLLSFILVFNAFTNKDVTVSEALNRPIFCLKIYNYCGVLGIEDLGKVNCINRKQFYWYVKQSYFGEGNLLNVHKFYSSLTGFQLTNAYNYFIEEFSRTLDA